MRPGMGAVDVLEICLEVDVISRKRVDGIIDVLFAEGGVEKRRGSYGLGESRDRNGLEGIVATDVMWDRIGDGDVLETAGRNLVVVFRVTPRPKALLGGVGKDGRVVKVRGIYFHVRLGTR